MVMKRKFKWKISSSNEVVQQAPKIFSNNTIVCPISFIQKCGLQVYISELYRWATKEPFHNTYLVIKAYIWKTFIIVFVRGQSKWSIIIKLNFKMHLQLIMDCK